MENKSIPSYNRLIGNDAQIKEFIALSEYINRWKPEIDAIKEAVPDEASSTNKLADKQWTDDKIAEESDFQKNFSAIMSLSMDASSGVTIDTINPDYKIAWVDSQSNVLIGKKQDNSWYYADDLDTILDTIISNL